MRNKQSNRNRKRNNNKSKSIGSLKLYRNIIASKAVREINVAYPVYIYNTGVGSSVYTLASGSATYDVNILTNIIASTEFSKMASAYQTFKFSAVRLRIVPAYINTALIATLPELYVDLVPNLTTVGPSVATTSDNAMVCNLRSASNNGVSCTYGLPPILAGSSGYIVGGTSVWLPSNAYVASPELTLVLGSLLSPTLVTVAASNYVVATIDVYAIMEFATPSIQ